MATKTAYISLFLSLFLLILSHFSRVGATHRMLRASAYMPPSPTCGDQIGNLVFEEAKGKTRKRKLCRQHLQIQDASGVTWRMGTGQVDAFCMVRIHLATLLHLLTKKKRRKNEGRELKKQINYNQVMIENLRSKPDAEAFLKLFQTKLVDG
ncbi:PREDICTED: uncharacterized protein LOC104724053 [Camelina sativa]|uniref:Uncharacterized protein LOC104724053 n=1 Tax=Camelina sativa TaxID=90675 RepID=A0ABM0UGG8_CAMSA|nr:PREDICTED: uncharacterized protein LOC104724053 [Camelina sativa]